MVTKNHKDGYWKEYYHRVKKHKVKEAKPIKTCQGCGLPIINPKTYKQNVHLTPGMRSDCQKKRDSDYKKEQRKLGNVEVIKIPKGLHDRFNIQKERVCLKCNEEFKSQSLHNRVCEKCKMLQEDIMNFSNMALESHNIEELLKYTPSLFMGDLYVY